MFEPCLKSLRLDGRQVVDRRAWAMAGSRSICGISITIDCVMIGVDTLGLTRPADRDGHG
jgi:hypothetical protein